MEEICTTTVGYYVQCIVSFIGILALLWIVFKMIGDNSK